MAGDRVDSISEARKLYREHRRHRHEGHVTDYEAGPAPRYGVGGTGMDGVDVDLEQLRQAEHDLADLHDGLVDHLRAAQDLSGPLNDGTSPVTTPMRKAFRDRADPEGGVQAALVDYLDQLVAVRSAILDTLATYAGVDGDEADRLNRQLAYLDQEGV